MTNRFPVQSSVEQTIKINELLGSNESYFDVRQIFNVILPKEIVINGKRGDLAITHNDICYFNVGASWTLNLILIHVFEPNEDVFDGAIKILEQLDDIRAKEKS